MALTCRSVTATERRSSTTRNLNSFMRSGQDHSVTCLSCERVADRPDAEGFFPSDHFGLVVDLSLKGTP